MVLTNAANVITMIIRVKVEEIIYLLMTTKHKASVWEARFLAKAFFFFFLWVPCTVHGTHKYLHSTTFSLKLDPTALFTHSKIILLQCFQFSIFSNKWYPNRPKIYKQVSLFKIPCMKMFTCYLTNICII